MIMRVVFPDNFSILWNFLEVWCLACTCLLYHTCTANVSFSHRYLNKLLKEKKLFCCIVLINLWAFVVLTTSKENTCMYESWINYSFSSSSYSCIWLYICIWLLSMNKEFFIHVLKNIYKYIWLLGMNKEFWIHVQMSLRIVRYILTGNVPNQINFSF